MESTELPASSSRERSILGDFDHFLERRDVKFKNFEGRIFYHPKRVVSWISSNAEKILSTVYTTGFPPIEASQINFSYLVLAILAHPSIQCANMIDTFKQHIRDEFLHVPNLTEIYAAVIRDLKSRHRLVPARFERTGYAGVTREFDKLRWSFCPVTLKFNMHDSFHQGMSILPFCHADVVNKKGGTANVHQIKIQTDLVSCNELREKLLASRHDDDYFGPCYEFAVKSYLPDWEDIYLLESNAFKGMKRLDGVVTYLGEYSLNESEQTPAMHNIMLEYGERDLDEYLADTYAPVLNNEIIAFWEGVFEIAETLQQMHKFKVPGANGQSRIFRGWHGDVKPDNILRVHGRYKLADFGFAKFEEDRKLYTYLLGGTRTFGAPECDYKRMGGTSTPHLQTIDTWSFGCVLSVVATWVVLGSQAYKAYDTIRERAIKELRWRQATEKTISTPTCDDAFHDGQKVLSAVTDWHQHLRNSTRRSDTITHMVLDLVDEKMLIVNPHDRLTSEGMCTKLQHILLAARRDYEKAVWDPDNLLKKETPQTLQALLELDNDAPAVAKPQADVKKTPSMEAREGDSSIMPPAIRVKKPERMDKILIGKVANRAPVLQAALLDAQEICDSPTLMSAVTEEHSPASQETLSGLMQPSASTDPPAPYEMASNETLLFREGLAEDANPAVHVSNEIENSSDGNRNQHRLDPSEIPTESQRTFPSANFGPDQRKDNSSDGNKRLDRVPSGARNAALVDHQMTAIYREYENQLHIWQKRGLISTIVGSGPSADPQLNKFISNRDITLVVDNAGSMRQYWKHVKTSLLALAMKIGRLDKDGLDLVFTIGDSQNLAGVKGDNIHKKFAKAMEITALAIGDSDHTDMATTLSRLFDAYKDTNKKQTLIILTDGLWRGGHALRSDVEACIKEFAYKLNRKLKKMEKRWFTIQFISFGRNKDALKRMEDLDDNLGANDDIVDHKPWDFLNVNQMILGSILEDADAAMGSSQVSREASIRKPSPSPSRSQRLSRLFGPSD